MLSQTFGHFYIIGQYVSTREPPCTNFISVFIRWCESAQETEEGMAAAVSR